MQTFALESMRFGLNNTSQGSKNWPAVNPPQVSGNRTTVIYKITPMLF